MTHERSRDTAARTLHARLLVTDMHSHPLLPLAYLRRDLSRAGPSPDLLRPWRHHWDLPRARAGGVRAQVCVAYTPPRPFRRRSPLADTLRQLDLFARFVAANGTHVAHADSVESIRRTVDGGRMALLLAVEGGHALEGRLDAVDALARRGVVYLTLTHFLPNALCDSRDVPWRGRSPLSPFGRRVVRRMSELGVLADVAHCTEDAARAVADLSDGPVAVTHTGLCGVRPTRRNCSDALLRIVAGTGGVVGVTAISALLGRWGVRAGLDRMVDHIAYAADRVGVDHVGLGADFDAWPFTVRGLDGPRDLPNLTEALLARGFHADEIERILGGNFLRVLAAVQARRTEVVPRPRIERGATLAGRETGS